MQSTTIRRVRLIVSRFLCNPWAPDVLAAVGALVYLGQAWVYMHTQASMLDEGMYLYEGFLFAIGRYVPYQDYGPRMYQFPLAYLIPGYLQTWFGPSLWFGRLFALLFSLLALVALWAAARRLGGGWLAAGAVWVMAANPAIIKMYSQADTQGIAAALLAGSLALTLGEERPAWQLLLGALLAGLTMMVRVNLLALLPLLALYIAWQNGWKLGLLSLAVGLLPGAALHAAYWPNILRIWAYWMPESLAPFLGAFRPPEAAVLFPPVNSLWARINSLSDGIRLFFVIFTGVLAAWLAWPKRSAWSSLGHFRAAVFLTVLFAAMLLMHGWASLATDNCVFCFPGYLAFFIQVGALIVVASLRSWQVALSPLRQKLAYAAVVGLGAAWGYSASSIVNFTFSSNLARDILMWNVPFLPGRHELWVYPANKLDLTYDQLYRVLRVLPSTLLGILISLALLFVVVKLPGWLARLRFLAPYNPGMKALLLVLLIGFIFTPTEALSGSYHSYDCSSNVIAQYEGVGNYLANYVRPGDRLYWRASDTPTPLLYVPDAQLFPAQLTGDYEFRVGGDTDALLKYGWWNNTLARKWVAKADVFLVEERYLRTWLHKILVKSGDYEMIPPSPDSEACRPDTRLWIFVRK